MPRSEYADRVVGWRTRPSPGTSNDEAALYGAAGLTYSPRQGLFAHVNELGLVLGIPPVFVERALPFVTIFNGSSNVDVTIASPEIVAAQSEKSSTSFGAANNASSSPSGLNENAGTLPDPDVASPKSGAFRASIQIKLRDARQTTSEVVFALGGEDVPYRVLSWQDELTSGQRRRKWARLK